MHFIFFVCVGPTLADEITQPKYINELDTRIIKRNSFLIRVVVENEIIQIVCSFKIKRSTGGFDIDMALIEDIINYIVTPLVYICSQSFLTGIFPYKMKSAEVIPIYKSGDKR